MYKGCSIKTEKNFEKKSIFSKLLRIYNRAFGIFAILCYIFHLMLPSFIKYEAHPESKCT